MSEEKNQDHHYDLIRKLKPARIILPVLIGIVVVILMMVKDMDLSTMREITFTWNSVFWLSVAFLLVIMRTFWYTARIKALCDDELTWLQAFRVILLWEFTSSITPSTVGGTAFAVVFLHKEGISVGKSTSVILLTSFLDELYFVVMFPLLLVLSGWKTIFIQPGEGSGTTLMNQLIFVALTGYLIILVWVVVVGYGLFFRPTAIKNLIIRLFSLPILKRWRDSAVKAGDDIVASAREFKMKPGKYWYKALLNTFLTWTSRYLVVNAILMAFFAVSSHFLVFARQLVLWIMMLVSPTPGGAGFAEVILSRYLSDLIPVDAEHSGGVSLAMAVIWRAVSYYPFLLAGVLVLPAWIERKFRKHTRT